MGDPFLNYFALFLLLFVVVVLFYGIIAIHDIPYNIAKSRDHPHQDAIHAAGWVSLFTLHALWPFLWIWAMAYRPERGWGFAHSQPTDTPPAVSPSELDDLKRRIAELESNASRAPRGKTASDKGSSKAPDDKRIDEKAPTTKAAARSREADDGTASDPDLRLDLLRVFKIFKIPVNQWSLATATLGGIIGIALLLLIMNYNHPFTKNARIYFAVTPVLPGVRGRVIEVPVETNKPLKQGDVLFRIDPKPYEYLVNQKKAMLAEAEQNVGSSRPRSTRRRRARKEPTRSSRWRSRIMTVSRSCSRRVSSRRPHSRHSNAISRPRGKAWRPRGPRRKGRGSLTPPISVA